MVALYPAVQWNPCKGQWPLTQIKPSWSGSTTGTTAPQDLPLSPPTPPLVSCPVTRIWSRTTSVNLTLLPSLVNLSSLSQGIRTETWEGWQPFLQCNKDSKPPLVASKKVLPSQLRWTTKGQEAHLHLEGEPSGVAALARQFASVTLVAPLHKQSPPHGLLFLPLIAPWHLRSWTFCPTTNLLSVPAAWPRGASQFHLTSWCSLSCCPSVTRRSKAILLRSPLCSLARWTRMEMMQCEG